MATEKIGFDITVNGVERTITSFKDLKKATKDLRDEQLVMSAKFGDTSVEATNAAKKIAELKDKVDDLNDSSKSLKGTGFEMLKQGFGQVREGLMNLDFDKVKTGLIAMSSGFVSMGKSAMASLTTIKGAIIATGIGALVVALATIYAYWDDIKGVVDGLTPELKKQNDLANENLKTQQNKLNAISGQENILKLQGKTEKEILQLKMKQTDEAIAASDIAIAQAEQTKIAQVEASKRNKDILQGIIAFVTGPISLLLQGIDLAGKAFGEDFGLFEGFTGGIAKMMFNPDEVAAEGDKSIEAAKAVNAKLKNDRAGLQLSINAIDTKAAEDKKKLLEQGSKDSKEAADKQVDYQVELQAKLTELRTQLIKDEEVKEQTILKNKFLADQKDLYNKGANVELLKALNDNFEQDKSVITDKYIKLKLEKEVEDNAKFEASQKDKASKLLSTLESTYQLELEQIEGNDLLKLQKEQEHVDEVYRINVASANLIKESTTDLDNKYAKDKIALEKRIAAETKKIKQEEISKGLDNVKNALQTGQNLSDLYFSIKSAKVKKGSKEEMDLAKQQFEMNKKFNLAMALINGVQSVLAITTVPDFTLGVASAIRIAASVTATAAGIAKIASSQFEGGGGGGSIPDTSASVASAPSTAQAPSIYGPGQGQSTTFSGNQNNNFAPVKAYVVETENRSTTNRVNKLVSESTYG